MSNIIPFVSSSPPPMDEDQTFGWEEDDDDDFGNFASAPAFATPTTEKDNLKGGGFVADWPATGETPGTPASGENSGKNFEGTEPESVDHSSSMCADVPDHVQEDRSDGADDDFADFAAFQGDTGRSDKPHIDSLPLKTTYQQRLDEDPDSDVGTGKGTETVMEKSRESTATDSGLFSTDMSPLPQSESLCISEGDKTMHSDDETFSDMPQDSQPPALSHSDSGQRTADPDPSRDEDSGSLCEDSQISYDKEPSRQSDTTLSPDQTDQHIPVISGVTEITENEAASEDDKRDNIDGSLCPNDQSSSPSPAIDSVEVDPEQSSISDVESSITDRNAEPESSSANDDGAIDQEVVEDSPETSADMPASVTQVSDEIPEYPQSSHECSENDEDSDWAAFETSPSLFPQDDANRQQDEPEDLVLRKDSIHFNDDEDLSGASVEEDIVSENEKSAKKSDEDEGEERKKDSAINKSFTEKEHEQSREDTPEDLTNTHSLDGLDKEADGQLEQPVVAGRSNESSDIPCVPSTDDQHSVLEKGDHSAAQDDDDFGNFRGETVVTQTIAESEERTNDSENEDFAEFPAAGASQGDNTGDDFGDFSSSRVVDVEDNEDDFGDFNSRSAAADASMEKDDFGAFSKTSADAVCEDDDFGDFSGQPSASSDSGWADFAETPKTSKSEDEFGSFSAPDEPAQSGSTTDVNTDHTSFPPSGTSSSSQNVTIRKNKLETSLKSCFPSPEMAQQVDGGDTDDMAKDTVDIRSGDRSQLGVLETILEYGLQFRSASRQTWQVVQHPSRKDPRVRLWSQLQDVDGSPAVIYQWGKSNTNSHLFHTLHIDTQNMLIGHKKRSVPIFATGLSLLEPIRGGKKGRETGGSSRPDQGAVPSMLSPTLVDSSPQETEQRVQDIPAVDFDWSSSGLTNPLTSHSLDLDFLVAQDTQTSDKPSVFQSELLDAPRSSVKSSQPLEDILKSVKPTSVRSRRDDAATSQMSSEALRVLASLPDLTFMQSKVLMFPIKN